jgi:hypothetical protein
LEVPVRSLLRRTIPAIAFALALTSALPAAAAPVGEPPPGKRCADVVDGAAAYTTQQNQTPPTVLAEAVLAKQACKAVRYNLLVFDEVTSKRPMLTLSGTATTDAAGRPVVRFESEVLQETGDQTVCVRFETRNGYRIFDRAPDTGCAELVLDGPPPGRSFR